MMVGQYKTILAGSLQGGTGWYLVVLVSRRRYWLVFGGKVSVWGGKGLSCLYILKKVEIWSDVTIAGRTDDEKGKIELLSQGIMDC